MIKSIPDHLMFAECRRILSERIRPIHYATLADAAAKRIIDRRDRRDRDTYCLKKIKEDVRERLPCAGDVIYTGAPLCEMLFASWIRSDTLPGIGTIDNDLRIECRVAALLESAHESCMRLPHMKNHMSYSRAAHAENVVKGLAIESVIKEWFRARFEFYHNPDNYGNYTIPCAHDFKLRLNNGRMLLVDVSGRARNGSYYIPAHKGNVDVRLYARLDYDDNAVIVDGVAKGNETGIIDLWTVKSAQRFIFWLSVQERLAQYSSFL